MKMCGLKPCLISSRFCRGSNRWMAVINGIAYITIVLVDLFLPLAAAICVSAEVPR